MTPEEILADVRLRLRGTSTPIPDPKWMERATRKANEALDRLDRGERVIAGGLVVRRQGDSYVFGPLDPVSCAEALLELIDLYGGHR